MATVAAESFRVDLQSQMVYQPPHTRPLTKLPRRKAVIRQPATIPPQHSTYEAIERVESKPPLDRCRSMVVPGLYVAYKTEAENRLTVMEGGERYTHAISISHSDERRIQLITHPLPDDSKVDVLYLTVPYPRGAGRFGLGLTPEQLNASIEFLSTAPPTDDAARTLITCPAHHHTDVMCIVAAHLSSVVEEDVEELLKTIDMVDELHSAWKGEVTGNEADVIRGVVSKMPCKLA